MAEKSFVNEAAVSPPAEPPVVALPPPVVALAPLVVALAPPVVALAPPVVAVAPPESSSPHAAKAATVAKARDAMSVRLIEAFMVVPLVDDRSDRRRHVIVPPAHLH